MPMRRYAVFVLTLVSALVASAGAAPPRLLSAVSRMTHGAAGAFDVQLPLAGGSGVECRSVKDGVTLVLTFDQALAPTVQVGVAAGRAVVGRPAVAANVVTVRLTGLTDAEAVALTVTGAKNRAGEAAAVQTVPLRTLFGDINGDGRVNAADAALAKAAAGKKVTGATFRSDLDADGALAAADVAKGRSAVAVGRLVAGGATDNTPPHDQHDRHSNGRHRHGDGAGRLYRRRRRKRPGHAHRDGRLQRPDHDPPIPPSPSAARGRRGPSRSRRPSASRASCR